jgi:hypothetical protein
MLLDWPELLPSATSCVTGIDQLVLDYGRHAELWQGTIELLDRRGHPAAVHEAQSTAVVRSITVIHNHVVDRSLVVQR